MSKVLIQLLLIVAGSAINFGLPVLFGIEEYGRFLKSAVLVLIVHRVIDILNEPLLSVSSKDEIFLYAVANSLLLLFLVGGGRLFFNFEIDFFLLFPLLLSGCYSIFLFRSEKLSALKGYLLCYLTIFAFLALFVKGGGQISVSRYLQVLSYVSVGVSLIFIEAPTSCKIDMQMFFTCLKRFPIGLGVGLSTLFFSYLLIWASKSYLADSELSGLKILFAGLQASLMLYPMSMKHVQQSFLKNKSSSLLPQLLFSMIYFLLISIVLTLLDFFARRYFFLNLPKAFFMFLLPAIPVFFLVILLERFLITRNQMKLLAITSAAFFLPTCSYVFIESVPLSGLLRMSYYLLVCYGGVLTLYAARFCEEKKGLLSLVGITLLILSGTYGSTGFTTLISYIFLVVFLALFLKNKFYFSFKMLLKK
ncbi:hypothetical protein ACQ0P8_13540 [Halodesulfovibrio aestuarii]|uniref:Uncharacterized protein n=1 Tax=Halodesulfovibrio aestuarii TaxID=126333 RepID=A0A8G2FI99_9BACT|nr:hypothetical protein [Halodesulfovibrio aestuarii]SHJ29059.1 hypothetical protein SAMN05660830_02092 [Halodesulfovibrio aestuarii]